MAVRQVRERRPWKKCVQPMRSCEAKASEMWEWMASDGKDQLVGTVEVWIQVEMHDIMTEVIAG